LDAIKHDLLKAVDPSTRRKPFVNPKNPLVYHADCEYDPLRNDGEPGAAIQDLNDRTQIVKIGNNYLKSTFLGFKPTGEVHRVEMDELPQSIIDALSEANRLEELERREREFQDRLNRPLRINRDKKNNKNDRSLSPIDMRYSKSPIIVSEYQPNDNDTSNFSVAARRTPGDYYKYY
jgi:hypothetical protein